MDKQRYENHLGQVDVRNMQELSPSGRRAPHHPSGSFVCSNDMENNEKMVLNWLRRDCAIAVKMECEMVETFKQLVDLLDTCVTTDGSSTKTDERKIGYSPLIEENSENESEANSENDYVHRYIPFPSFIEQGFNRGAGHGKLF